MTYFRLTKYERTRIIGQRAMQISNGAKPKVKTENMDDPVEIAEKELEHGLCPIKIIRTLPNGEKHVISVKDLC